MADESTGERLRQAFGFDAEDWRSIGSAGSAPGRRRR